MIADGSRKLVNLFICTLASTICLLAVPSARSSEPVFNGRPLSEWLLFNSSPTIAEHLLPEGSPSPAEAIRQIGTNGIPTLLEILGATPQNEGWVLWKLKSKALKRQMRGDSNSDDLTDFAVDGFGVLGTNAESAVPKITKLLHSGQITSISPALRALAEIGPKGIAVVTNTLSDPDDTLRGVAIWVVGEKSGMDSNTVARLMIASFKNDPQNRADAARYLGGKDPAVAIPALLEVLDENKGDFDIVVAAGRALGSYGAAAEPAVPELLSIFTNHVADLDRHSAQGWVVELMWILPGIDKGAAAKAEEMMVNSGPLSPARFGYTKTLLPNGKELIVGGYLNVKFITVSNHFLSSAELLDPATGKWTETSEMNIARWDHMAILLRNGKVLVVGGSTRKESDSTSAELYDPTTEKWIVTGSLNHTHRSAQAVLRSDGKVLMPGGWDGRKITDDELYDPATEKWNVIPKK
jgi:hypothetical protein